MSRVGTFSAGSYRAWLDPSASNTDCANSGYTFPLLVPDVSDGYTLSQLGTPQLNAYAWDIDTGFIKYLINGQGRGVFGTGEVGDTSPSRYMLLYDPTGTSSYTYSNFDDCFQTGTPHEMGIFEVDNSVLLGGGNEQAGGTLVNNTVRSWKTSDGRIVVLMGGTTYGHAVFQYFSYPGESMVRMQMSYTNTTATSHTLLAQRGGDCDFDGFPTTNGRGINPVAPNNVAFSVGGYSSGKSVCVYTPGNGFTCNTAIIAAWPLYDPTTVLTGVNYGFGDFSAYNAWNLGTVTPGQTVYVTCFYIVGQGLSDFPTYIC
jgi:hypothetical protein